LKCHIDFSIKVGIVWNLLFDLALDLNQNILQEVWKNDSIKLHLVLVLFVCK
jgi:hypothetical protein